MPFLPWNNSVLAQHGWAQVEVKLGEGLWKAEDILASFEDHGGWLGGWVSGWALRLVCHTA